MTTTTTIPAWVDTLQAAITATEWEWRQLDEQEWRNRDRDGQVQTALAKTYVAWNRIRVPEAAE